MITARYKWEVATVEKGFVIHRKTLQQAKIIPIMAVILLSLGAYLSVRAGHSWTDGLPPMLFVAIILLLWRPLAFWQFRRAVHRSPSYGTEMTWNFDPQQITLSGEGFNSTFTWQKVYSATLSDQGLLLYPQKNLFHWIPASAFSSLEDFATVRSLVAQKCVRVRNA